MDYEILDKKIKRLQCKLKKYNIEFEVFEADDITYGDILGRGGEGLVQKCTVRYNGIGVDAAIKTINVEDDDGINITLDEIELLCLASDHILDSTLRVYGVTAIPDEDDEDLAKLAIITEAGLMNALQLYQEEEVPLYVTYDLWGRIAGAVHCLHKKKIIHHDLKPENILITAVIRDKKGEIEKLCFKIIDFGMGRRMYTKKIITDDILGTNGYHPPEVLQENSYDFRADVFMLGVTFSVLLHANDFLKSSQFQNLLRKLHTSKKRGMVGHDLYETLMEHNIEDTHDEISPLIKSMLCNMLETQENRVIALDHVVSICREESEREKKRHALVTPQLTPISDCQDSGFGSGLDGSAGEGNSKREEKGNRRKSKRTTRSKSTSSSSSCKGLSQNKKRALSTSTASVSEQTPRRLRPRKVLKRTETLDESSDLAETPDDTSSHYLLRRLMPQGIQQQESESNFELEDEPDSPENSDFAETPDNTSSHYPLRRLRSRSTKKTDSESNIELEDEPDSPEKVKRVPLIRTRLRSFDYKRRLRSYNDD